MRACSNAPNIVNKANLFDAEHASQESIAPCAILFPYEWDEEQCETLLARVPMGRAGDP